MIFFQEFFVTASVALILSCIIVKFVTAVLSNDGRVDKEKIVMEESKITKGLVVTSRKSKKRVKFVEQEAVASVDHVETEKPNKDGVEVMSYKVEVVVDQSENAGEQNDEEGFVEKKAEGVLKKDDDFKGEKVCENPDLVEHCGGEREVNDGHEDADMYSKIGFLEDNEVGKFEGKNEGVLKKDDDFKGEKVYENLGLSEHCGGEKKVGDAHDDLENSCKIVLMEKNIEGILKKGDDFKGEKVSENLDLIELCGGERKVSDVHDDPEISNKIVLMEEKVEKKIEDILKKGDDFKVEKVPENIDSIAHCGGEREVSNVHEDADTSSIIGLMEEKDEVNRIDELLVHKEKDIMNALVVDEIEVGGSEVVEVGGGLSKVDDERTDKMVMDEDSDDDWEGIERSELEGEFVKAVNFVDGGNGKNSGTENLGSELMMQLYGLQKIAMEGPCHEPQPMALKVYARAKWNAWQKLGSMNPEVAMDQYIKLLSDNVPQWTHHSKDDCEVQSSETKMPGNPVPDSSYDACKEERTQEMNHATEGGDFSGGEKE